MKERPILFSGPMVKAILDGRKTQTRRVIKAKSIFDDISDAIAVHPDGSGKGWIAWWGKTAPSPKDTAKMYPGEDGFKCPYGQPGDRLWVRETIDAEMYASKTWNGLTYKADGGDVIADHPPGWTPPLKTIKTHRESGDNIPGGGFDWYTGTVPSIFMPRWASRITLEITGIRVERLQEISEEDAVAEGLSGITKDGRLVKYGIPDRDGYPGNDDYGWHWSEFEKDSRLAYRKLWESINGQGSWGANPWVWVVEFRKVDHLPVATKMI